MKIEVPRGYTKEPIEVDLYAIVLLTGEKIKLGILRPCHIKDKQYNISINQQYEFPYHRYFNEWDLEMNNLI